MSRCSFVWPSKVAAAGLVFLGACDPYGDFADRDQSLGPVDPVNFPAANLGAGGNRMRAGTGVFVETPAFSDGVMVGYFGFPYDTPNPANLPPDNPAIPYFRTAPNAYVFNPTDADPLPETYPCITPPGWSYNAQEDDVRLDLMAPVFTALPSATYQEGMESTTGYTPIVTELAANSEGRPCQEIKSQEHAQEIFGSVSPEGVKRPPDPSGKYLAWFIIDPAAGVYRFDEDPDMAPGLGLQSWGWFQQYLLAFLDGGYLPITSMEIMAGMAMVPVNSIQTQVLYYPSSDLTVPGPGGTMVMAAGELGAGYDVLSAKRGDMDYSPVCRVRTYEIAGAPTPDALPKTAEEIEALPMANIQDASPPFIFCLQVRQP